MENIKKIIALRQTANREILKDINEMVEKYPDLRFGQILVNLGIVQLIKDPASFDIIGVKDPFNEESIVTLYRIRKND